LPVVPPAPWCPRAPGWCPRGAPVVPPWCPFSLLGVTLCRCHFKMWKTRLEVTGGQVGFGLQHLCCTSHRWGSIFLVSVLRIYCFSCDRGDLIEAFGLLDGNHKGSRTKQSQIDSPDRSSQRFSGWLDSATHQGDQEGVSHMLHDSTLCARQPRKLGGARRPILISGVAVGGRRGAGGRNFRSTARFENQRVPFKVRIFVFACTAQ